MKSNLIVGISFLVWAYLTFAPGSVAAQTPASFCSPYLREAISWQAQNNPIEVAKLQAFLRTREGATQVWITGQYDRVTLEAVTVFQQKYAEDILRPWGIIEPTGYVFITTRSAINNLYCGRTTAFKGDLRNFYAAINRSAESDAPPLALSEPQNLLAAPPPEPVEPEPAEKLMPPAGPLSLASLEQIPDLEVQEGGNTLTAVSLLLVIAVGVIIFLLFRLKQGLRSSRNVAGPLDQEILIEPPEEELFVDQFPLDKIK